MDELLKLCEPVMKYMDEHCDPYTKVVIDMDGVKIFGTELSIPRNEGRPGFDRRFGVQTGLYG